MTQHELPFRAVFPADLITDRSWRRMGFAERGMLATLENFAWLDGDLPLAVEDVSRLIGAADADRPMLTRLLDLYFPPARDVRRSPSLEEERQRALARRESYSARGKKGGRPRKAEGEPESRGKTEVLAELKAEGKTEVLAELKAEGKAEPKASISSFSSSSSCTETSVANATGAEPRAAGTNGCTPHRSNEYTDGQLIAYERSVLWAPDRKPPGDWTEGRSFKVYRELREKYGYSGGRIMLALEGLDVLRRTGEVDWIAKSAKVTVRALYHTGVGVVSSFEFAEAAAVREAEKRGRRRGPEPVGKVLAGMTAKARIS